MLANHWIQQGAQHNKSMNPFLKRAGLSVLQRDIGSLVQQNVSSYTTRCNAVYWILSHQLASWNKQLESKVYELIWNWLQSKACTKQDSCHTWNRHRIPCHTANWRMANALNINLWGLALSCLQTTCRNRLRCHKFIWLHKPLGILAKHGANPKFPKHLKFELFMQRNIL